MRRLIILAFCALLLFPMIASAQPAQGPIVRFANLQLAANALGNGNTLDVSQASTAIFQVSGTLTSLVVTFECSLDGLSWNALEVYPIGSSTGATTTASTGIWRANVSGMLLVRARVSTYVSGTVTVKANATSLGYSFAATNN